MTPFEWGLLTGLLAALVVAAAGGAYAYRRFVLLERRARQAERLAELGTLTGGLAHEIKNPLSTVQLNLQLLEEDLNPAEDAHVRIVNRLHTVQRETNRMRDILDDFLRYAGKLELDRQPVELQPLLSELVDFFSPQAQLSRVQLRLRPQPVGDGPPKQIIARVDARLIKQAVLNLMLNAMNAMESRGGGELILGAHQDGREACIDVIDTGGGIPANVVGKIFDAYYSTRKGGTGLGLAMTQRIITEHGGSIAVESAEGKGSKFTIRLPR